MLPEIRELSPLVGHRWHTYGLCVNIEIHNSSPTRHHGNISQLIAVMQVEQLKCHVVNVLTARYPSDQ